MGHVPTASEVETHSGRYVDCAHPLAETLTLDDIAHALSQACRYGGHCDPYYSVAEHAVFVSRRLERRGYSKAFQLAGLHHDDAEAYLGDIPRPLKPLLGEAYGELTDRMDNAICVALPLPFGWTIFHDHAVKEADNWALMVEARYLLPSEGRSWTSVRRGADGQPEKIVTPDYWKGGLQPFSAKALYLARHEELTTCS